MFFMWVQICLFSWNSVSTVKRTRGSYTMLLWLSLFKHNEVTCVGPNSWHWKEKNVLHRDFLSFGRWFLADLNTTCSATCGEGVRTRVVVCLLFAVDGVRVVDDSFCDDSEKPSAAEPCTDLPDCPGTWVLSSWSEVICPKLFSFSYAWFFCYFISKEIKYRMQCRPE